MIAQAAASARPRLPLNPVRHRRWRQLVDELRARDVGKFLNAVDGDGARRALARTPRRAVRAIRTRWSAHPARTVVSARSVLAALAAARPRHSRLASDRGSRRGGHGRVSTAGRSRAALRGRSNLICMCLVVGLIDFALNLTSI